MCIARSTPHVRRGCWQVMLLPNEYVKEHGIIRRIVFRLVRKRIAGSTLGSLMKNIMSLNERGMHTTATLLNDRSMDLQKAKYNTNSYLQMIRQISRLHLNSDISLRPSQLGYSLSREAFGKNIEDIASLSAQTGVKAWLEIENNVDYDSVLSVYTGLRDSYGSIGMEVPYGLNGQAFKQLSRKDGHMKIVIGKRYTKGQPNEKRKEPNGKAGKKAENKNRIDDMVGYFGRAVGACRDVTISDTEEGNILRIANRSKELKKGAAFELPFGESNKKLNKLIKSKINLSIYTPYGKDWVTYAINRLAEGHIRRIASAVLSKSQKGSNAQMMDDADFGPGEDDYAG